MKIKKIDHVVITSKNIHATLAFYEKLGFISKHENERYELFAGDFKINVHIFGKELFPHAKNIQPGSKDICFEIDADINEFKQSIEQKGLIIEIGIVERTGVRGKMESIYLRDPDGNLVEFCSYL